MNLLSQQQKDQYLELGYLGLPGLVSQDWLEKLNAVTDEFVVISQAESKLDSAGKPMKDKRFDLEPDHAAGQPRIRRLNSPVDQDDLYWRFASRGPFADIAEDLLGPDVKFHHSKLNFKWSGGGEEVKWHQDIQFWPHTNYDVLTLGIYLTDVDDDMSPMGVIPKSHQGPLYDLYDTDGNWTGNIREADISSVDVDSATYLKGLAGTITVHNCRSVHGSAVNSSNRVRPLLLCAYSAGDAIPITNLTQGGKHSEAFVRGQPARWARFDPRPCLMPPDWSKQGGQKSIFEHQQKR